MLHCKKYSHWHFLLVDVNLWYKCIACRTTVKYHTYGIFEVYIWYLLCKTNLFISFFDDSFKIAILPPSWQFYKEACHSDFIWTTGFIHTISTLEFKDSLVHSFYHFGFTIRRYFYYINTWFICQKYIIALRYNCFNQISVCWNNRNPAIRRTSR